jgi:hypothetical protein
MASESYLASVAARLARKVSVDKAGQGRKGKWDPARTALLVDISTAHLARPWLDDVLVDWQGLPFAAVAVCFSHLHGVSSGGAAGTGRIWTLLRGRAWNPSCPARSHGHARTPVRTTAATARGCRGSGRCPVAHAMTRRLARLAGMIAGTLNALGCG